MTIRSYPEALDYLWRNASQTQELREFIRLVVAAWSLSVDVESELEDREIDGHRTRLADLEADARRILKLLDQAEFTVAKAISYGREADLHEAMHSVVARARETPFGEAA